MYMALALFCLETEHTDYILGGGAACAIAAGAVLLASDGAV